MFRRFLILLALMGIAGLGFSCTERAENAPDLILHNGFIWTVDDAQPQAQAVAIKEGAILAVGNNETILALADGQSELLDLQGHMVTPGFVDTHIHFASAARFLEFNLMRTITQDAFVQRVEEVVAQLPAGEWILGGLWGAYDEWTAGSSGFESREPFTPNMVLVNERTANHPMFLRKFDNSEFAVNTAALAALGLNPDSLETIAGVQFVHDDDGQFTGILRGTGVTALFSDVIPRSFSHERRLFQTRHALDIIRQYGVTSVSDMSDDAQLDIYHELLESEELTARIEFRYQLDRWQELAERGIQRGSGSPWIRLGALKGHIDGIMGTSTARFFEPYENNPANYGRWRRLMVDENGNFIEGQFLNYMLRADSANLQLSIHAIGDEANHLLMNYLNVLAERNGEKDRRFRLVHAQVIADPDFARLAELGLIAEVQPFHLSDDMRWMEERIGPRIRGAYAFKALQDSGAILAFGSDWPGTSAAEYPINPMLGLYAAVSRQTVTGKPEGGWFPAQRISMAEAIKAYTYNGAYATFEEDLKGSITVGKRADLVVLSKNLFEIAPAELLETEVLYTFVDGRRVYERGAE